MSEITVYLTWAYMIMRLLIRTVPAATLALLISFGFATAEENYIQCPAASLSLSLDNKIPAEWNYLSAAQPLQSVEVYTNNGNQRSLRCTYQGGFVLERSVPQDSLCSRDSSSGFKCVNDSFKNSNRRDSLAPMEFTLRPRETLDLDGVNSSPWDNDIWLDGSDRYSLAITAFAEGSISAAQDRPLKERTCQRASFESQPILLSKLKADQYFCVKTGRGEYIAVKVIDVDLNTDPKIVLRVK